MVTLHILRHHTQYLHYVNKKAVKILLKCPLSDSKHGCMILKMRYFLPYCRLDARY